MVHGLGFGVWGLGFEVKDSGIGSLSLDIWGERQGARGVKVQGPCLRFGGKGPPALTVGSNRGFQLP